MSERWAEEVKEEELFPPCPIEQIDLGLQAPPQGHSHLAAVSLFIPVIGVALCLSEEDTRPAAHLHNPALQSRVTLALPLPIRFHIRSHTLNLSLMPAGLSMEVSCPSMLILMYLCACVC